MATPRLNLLDDATYRDMTNNPGGTMPEHKLKIVFQRVSEKASIAPR